MWYDYEKLDENGKIEHCPQNDDDGSITGHVVLGLKEWYDENPQIRIEHGWIKHIHWDHEKEPEKFPTYDKTREYLVCIKRQVDELTVEDSYEVFEKSEEQMILQELLENLPMYGDDFNLII